MKRALLLLGMLISGFFVWFAYDSYHAKSEYIEACLYFSNSRDTKQKCYEVYPEDHERQWLIKGVVAVVVFGALGLYYLDDKLDDGRPHPANRHPEEH